MSEKPEKYEAVTLGTILEAIQGMRQEFSEKFDSVEQRIGSIENKVDAVSEQVAAMQEDIYTIKEDVTTIKEDIRNQKRETESYIDFPQST